MRASCPPRVLLLVVLAVDRASCVLTECRCARCWRQLFARGGALPISLVVGPAFLTALSLAACARRDARAEGGVGEPSDGKGKRDDPDELM